MQHWIGVDFDGTLAYHSPGASTAQTGAAIGSMVLRVRQWLDSGLDVRIVSARGGAEDLIPGVHDWLVAQGLPKLTVTARRDPGMLELWDDRAIRIEMNTGEVLAPKRPPALGSAGWVGMELDGTLAQCSIPQPLDSIGEPVPRMLNRARQLMMAGIPVKLFTGRAALPEQIPLVQRWLDSHGLQGMAITCEKDFRMLHFLDDRAMPLHTNTGEPAIMPTGFAPPPKYST